MAEVELRSALRFLAPVVAENRKAALMLLTSANVLLQTPVVSPRNNKE